MDNRLKHRLKRIVIVVEKRGVYYTDLSESFYRGFNNNNLNASFIEISPDFRNGFTGRIRYKLLTSSINKSHLQKINENAAQKIIASKPDLIFVIKGTYLLPKTIRYLKNNLSDCKFVCFNPDDPFNVNNASSNIFIKNSIFLYDKYFIWSYRIVEKLKMNQVKDVHYFPFALDDKIIYPVYLTDNELEKYSSGAVFIGNGDEKRNKQLTEICSLMNEKKLKIPLRVYGNNIKKQKSLQVKEVINNEKLLKAFTAAKINLNLLREQNINSINMRTFEIPGTKSFMLHEHSEEAMEFFRPGIEAEYFLNSAECADKIEFYIKNEKARNKIAEAGYKRIFSEGYTYTEMIRKLFIPVLE